jgi:hypothetical protein
MNTYKPLRSPIPVATSTKYPCIVIRFKGAPLNREKIPKTSKKRKFRKSGAIIVCGGTMIVRRTQANQNFFNGKLKRANPYAVKVQAVI